MRTAKPSVSQLADCLEVGLSPREVVLDAHCQGVLVGLIVRAQPEDDVWHHTLQAGRQRPRASVEPHHERANDLLVIVLAVRVDEAKQTVPRSGVHFRGYTPGHLPRWGLKHLPRDLLRSAHDTRRESRGALARRGGAEGWALDGSAMLERHPVRRATRHRITRLRSFGCTAGSRLGGLAGLDETADDVLPVLDAGVQIRELLLLAPPVFRLAPPVVVLATLEQRTLAVVKRGLKAAGLGVARCDPLVQICLLLLLAPLIVRLALPVVLPPVIEQRAVEVIRRGLEATGIGLKPAGRIGAPGVDIGAPGLDGALLVLAEL
eukprot:scaffold34990_cov66-Phaeocystis_antarctica.AAC.3